MNPIQALIDAAEGMAVELHAVARATRHTGPVAMPREKVMALRAAIPAARAELEKGDRYANFGRAFVAMIGTDDWWWHNEWSEDVMPLACQAGIAERVPYDPEIHGEDVEAEPGDEIWVWLPIPPKENTDADQS